MLRRPYESCLNHPREIYGTNVLFVGYWHVRETTPCGLTRDSGTMGTPGSTTRSTYSTAAKWRMQNPICQDIPTTREMEEFFVGLERLQQQIFIEKYIYSSTSSLFLN